ncbi:MAG: hypothetical protein Q8L98_03100 [Chlamydiales bacterium]|nr:hypothetical protein [Chlamydiales bacterium]
MINTINYTAGHLTFSINPEVLNFSFERPNLKSSALDCIMEIFSKIKELFLYFTLKYVSKTEPAQKVNLSSNRSTTLSTVIGEELAEEFNKRVGKHKLSPISYEKNPEQQIPIDVARTISILVIHNNEQKVFDKTSAPSPQDVYKNISDHVDSIFPNEKDKRDLILKRSDQGVFNSVFFEILLSGNFTQLAREIAPLYSGKNGNDLNNSCEPLEYHMAQSSEFKGSHLITHKIEANGSIINSGSVFIDLFVIENGDKETIFSFEVAFACNLVTEEYDEISCKLLRSQFMSP